ncbi:MAG: response regulator transcription factor [Patescibacteria group bacterium]|nr:response regulator transcription factor [Patescibacteria group bacterium]
MPDKKKKAKILIVEDDAFLLNIYQTVFEKEGYEVMTAGNGEDGFGLALEQSPDVMLLDIMLPGGMNGLAVLKKLKQTKGAEKIPVMIISNLSDDKTIGEGMSLGAAGYFPKSQFSPDEVLKNVRELIR